MGKTLVLAEKPSVGRDLAKVLGCTQNGNGFISGKEYVVTWALGHLVTLAEPEAYGERYKAWRLEDLPMLPDKMQLVVIRETAKQFQVVKSLLKREDMDGLIIATDSGREGELVARWIIQKAGFSKPVKRLWISSQTERAIKEGFRNLKPSKEYDALYRSAQCRAEADWLVGLNVTRALTCKYNAQLSAGRVQTPTLAMIIDRENEIRRFVPKEFWTVNAAADGFSLLWQDRQNGQPRLFDKTKAEAVAGRLRGVTGTVVELRKEARQELPPLAYDLTELQRDANRRFGFSAKQTLSIMQRLYETHKLVTYPRTDSRHITEDIVPTLPERLKSIGVGPYAEISRSLLKNKLRVTKRFVDNSKVTDHHAIIPTEQYVDLNSLNSEERKIYDLIVKRFFACLSQPYEYEQTTVGVEAAGELLHAGGKIIRSLGWKSVYSGENLPEDEDEDGNDDGGDGGNSPGKESHQSLPELKMGQKIGILSVKLASGRTKPPARYTEATLLTAMEHPGRFVGDKGLREMLESSNGLGTPATRADIIEKLFDSFYIERNGREIVPTSKGMQLIGLVPDDLKSPELTGKWEQQLKLIGTGKANADAYVNDMKKYAAALVSKVISSTDQFRHDNLTREKCPECGKYLLEVKGRKGRMLICQDRECGWRKSLSQVSNARCPQCHKKMELRGEGEDRSFYCACGYREKLEAFKKRNADRVDKKEVNRFLKGQEEDTTINNALAEALKNWNR